MASPQQTGLPNSSLVSVSEQLERYLAGAVEVADDEAPRHDMFFGNVLRIAGSERTPTALRFFCLPFEELLTVNPRKNVKQKGRIARDSTAPIWTRLGQILLPLETKFYCCNFKSAIAAADHAKGKIHAADFWRVAGAAMRAALASESGRRTARQILKSELVLADAQEAALMLCIAPAVVRIRELLVRPVPALTEELLNSLRNIHDDLAISEPGAAPYVAVIAMNRLARPWEVLQLSRRPPDLVGDIIFSDIQMVASAVRCARHPDFDVDLLLDNIAHFTSFHSGILGDDALCDDKLRRLLSREGAALAETVDGFMRRAPSILAEALRRPDAEKVEQALRTVRLVMGRKPFANVLGPSVSEAEDAMCRMLLSHNECLFERNAVRRGPAGFAASVKLTSALLGVEHGEFLRRRGSAALGAQVA